MNATVVAPTPVRSGGEWDGLVRIAVRHDGRTASCYSVLRSSGALAVRATADTAWLVGASAHPIGGDRLRVELDVGPEAELAVRSTSATVARKSVPARPSFMEIEAVVAAGAVLRWNPAPGVAARGSIHHASALVSLADGARLYWAETVVLGRHGEPPGSWSSRIRVETEGRPLLVSELGLGPANAAWLSPAVLDGAACISCAIFVDPVNSDPATALTSGDAYAVAVNRQTLQCMAWGDTYVEVFRKLEDLYREPALARWVECIRPGRSRPGADG